MNMKTLVAVFVILESSSGQFLAQPPLISSSAPRVWYPIFSPVGVSLRNDPGTCADDIIKAAKLNQRAGTIVTQIERISGWSIFIDTTSKRILRPWFKEGLSELMFWSEKGAKCSGGKYEGRSLNTLKNCSTAVNNNCDRLNGIKESLSSLDCYFDAEEIVIQYKVSNYKQKFLRKEPTFRLV